MAIIEVNQQKITFDQNSYLNIKSFIPKLQKEFPIEDYALDFFRVNGHSVDINSEDPLLIRPINDQDHIQISFHQNRVNIKNIIVDLGLLIDRILSKIEKCASDFKDDDQIINDVNLSQIIEGVDTFINTVKHILADHATKHEHYENLPIKELQIHLLSVLKAINSVFQKDDLIMLTDLLEFELKDNLTQWKILILPTLKSKTNTIA